MLVKFHLFCSNFLPLMVKKH